jgi:hypothetical protein
MKRRAHRWNPGALVTLGWAAGSAAVAATVSYVVLREYYANKVARLCVGALTRQGNPASEHEIRSRARSML